MSLSEADISKAANDLLNAEKTLEQIGLLTLRHPSLDMDGAYTIQKELASTLCHIFLVCVLLFFLINQEIM